MYTKAKRHGAKPSHASSPTDRSLLPMPTAGRGSHGARLSDLSEAGLRRESEGRGPASLGGRHRDRFIRLMLRCYGYQSIRPCPAMIAIRGLAGKTQSTAVNTHLLHVRSEVCLCCVRREHQWTEVLFQSGSIAHQHIAGAAHLREYLLCPCLPSHR